MPQAGLDIRRPRVPGLYDCKPVLRRSVEDSSHAAHQAGKLLRGDRSAAHAEDQPPVQAKALLWSDMVY
jgi:hypothetical protein